HRRHLRRRCVFLHWVLTPAGGCSRLAVGGVGGCSRLAAGGWRLAAGDWRLATGDWRLATGDWRLAVRRVQLPLRLVPSAEICGFRWDLWLPLKSVASAFRRLKFVASAFRRKIHW